MKIILTFLVSLIPINRLKIWVYNFFKGYKISYDSKIGFLNVLCATKFTADKVTIGNFNFIHGKEVELMKGVLINKFNRIKNINRLLLKEKAIIYSWNFVSGIPEKSKHTSLIFDNQNLTLGKESSLLRKNYVDLVNEVVIGDNVVFGGNGSEIWTHGFDIYRTMLVGRVTFGNNIFIGSGCIFTKGINVSDETIIAPGSIIYKSITEKGIYSTHEIRKIK
ncbi:acyltransferase [Abyssalbus ytuae]|uniref:Acyltransferase n=1 Tax=Abyssalbus ytuae TaxID=2926907 RepID=A0A9E7D4X4_9FLAO|nr:hypothetical protein [Abyssalbus ytuae]UOB19419.1 hypothetical protein MQE35_08995 [Abyssalbus ytuae]